MTDSIGGVPKADSDSLELPMAELPTAHPCSTCGECCTYVAIEIDNPTVFQDYENLHWYLTHENLAVYIDFEGDWFIEFKTRCKHLSDQKTCGIYEERPKICSEFSWQDCEKTSNERAYRYKFDDYTELVSWMEEKRPSQYAKYTKQRAKLIEKRRAQLPGVAPESRSAAPVELSGAETSP